MASIPASQLVSITPSVLNSGGTGLDLNGLMLTTNPEIPIGSVLSFATQADVAAYFGASSSEAAQATVYFAGFDGSNIKPGAMLFAQYPAAAVAGYMRGGALTGVTLANLNAITTGTITVSIDGTPVTSSTVDLSTATSFSMAAQLLNAELAIKGVQAASVTGTIATTVLTVSAVGSGTIAVGDVITGTSIAAGTYITSLGTGTGGTGTYNLSSSNTVGSPETITVFNPGVTYDSIANAFQINSGTTGATSSVGYATTGTDATTLKLTAATGAVLSPGAAIAVPSTFMNGIVANTTNWATFGLNFDPDNGSGNTLKLAFATWNGTQNNRYLFSCWDTDITPTQSANATGSMGHILEAAATSGTVLSYQATDLHLEAFVMGWAASIDFTETDGRTTLAFRNQSGLSGVPPLSPTVTNATVASNLIANGYNFLGSYSTANDSFTLYQDGQVTGTFDWADSYINQIWLNNALQLALMNLLAERKSIPYNDAGMTLINAALQDPISAALNFGAIRANVALSAQQAAEVNQAAGVKIDAVLSTRGWYVQVLPASPTTRTARGSPPITLWYMDGGSIQKINLASIEVQ